MSLVELVIALGIGAVVATVAVEYSKKLAHVQRNIVTMSDVASMNAEFINTTNRPTDCSALFPALPVAGFNAAAATGAGGMPITIQLANRTLADGSMIGSHMQVVTSRFHVVNPGSVFTSYTPAGSMTYLGVIRLRLQKTMITTGGTAMADQSFGPIALRVNAANQIVQCVSLQSAEYQCITSITSTNNWDLGTNTCTNAVGCPAQALSWTVGADTCTANFSPQAASSVSPTSTDSTLPSLGTAAFTCDASSAWSVTPEAGATCTSIVCPAQALSWTVGANTCSAFFAAAPEGSISPTGTDATSPTLGAAAFACDNTGTWNPTPLAGASCTSLSCPAQLLSWTVGADTCSENFPVIAAGSISATVTDATGPSLGSAAFTCENSGLWRVTPEPGATCTSTVCPAQALSWTVGSETCTANFPITAAGSISPTETDSTLPALGSAAFTCENTGLWRVTPEPGATCTATVCPAQSLSWTVGANTCSANFPATASGSTQVRGDLAPPSKGYAAFRCNAGIWSVAPEASSPTPYCSASPDPCSASCPDGVVASLGGYWVPCAGNALDLVSMTCEVTATEHSFPLPAEACDLSNPTWSCPLP